MPATGRLDRHAGVHQRQARRSTPRPSTSTRWRRAPRRRAAACRRTPPGSARRAARRGRRGLRGRSRGASANRPGRPHRWPTAACCSGGGSASASPGVSVSRSWFIRGMASVQTFNTCVSPRWNRPEPWAVGSTPTSAETGRRSATPRPSMRTPSSTMRLRTSFLVSLRTASLISRSRPANSPGASDGAAQLDDGGVAGGVDGRVAILLERDRHGLGQVVGGDPLDSGEHVGAEVDDRRERQRLDRAVGGDDRGDELALQLDRLLDPRLGGVEAGGENRLVDLLGALGVVGEALLGAAGLDHHDRDVAVFELAPGDDELEHRGVGLLERRVRDPLAVGGEGDAHGADRPLERDAADHQRRRRGVDRQHVVGVLLVGADDGGDDLRLVAEAVGERRAQRAVGEPAGEDGVLGGTALTAEERAGDLAGGVRPLLDVDGEGEEVDAGAHVAGGVRRRQHGGAADRRRRPRPGSAGPACRSRTRASCRSRTRDR